MTNGREPTNRHRAFLGWVAVLSVSAIINFSFGPIDDFLARLSPVSIFQLPSKAWPSILATVLASVGAWLAALLIGGILGLFAASGSLASSKSGWLWKSWSVMATMVRRSYSWLFVVPLVLTISVVTTVLLKLELNRTIGQSMVGLLLILASGIALAGQRVFVAIDDAVASASTDEILLSRSLFFGPSEPATGQLAGVKRLWREARFLVACRIPSIAQALEQAFHLAVVGVVILETVSGERIYERIFPQEAHLLPWGGGIGRVIIDGQSATNPELVAGAVWLILVIDSLIAWGIREATFRRWVTPYRRQQ